MMQRDPADTASRALPSPARPPAVPGLRGSEPRLRIGIVLARRFTLGAFATFVDVLRLAADEGDRSRQILCSWRILSATGDPVEASCGVALRPDERPGDPRRFDYIAVIGGLIGGDRDAGDDIHPGIAAFLQAAAAARVPLIGICTGAFILHRLGLMAGYKCCVSWFHHDDFLREFEGLQPVTDRVFVADRDRLTCSGGASSAHLAAFLVDRHIGRAAAQKSLSIMILDASLDAERLQPGLPMALDTADPLVKRALLLMQQTMAAPLPVARLAERLGTGRRRLERHFAAALGMTPAEANRRIRLEAARALLARGDRSVTEIAADTGFCDASHLIRLFRTIEGMPPDSWRRRQRAPA